MNHAIIVAAGQGKRMNSKLNKILLTLDDKPIIHHSIKPFQESGLIDDIIIVANKDSIEEITKLKSQFPKIKKVIQGGEYRQDSVYNGIKSLEAKEDDIILIHNGANPFISKNLIEETIKNAKQFGAAAVAIKAKDTIKETDKDNLVKKTLDRYNLWQMQTPQAMTYSLAIKAFEKAKKDNYYGTDDVELIERLGNKVKIVESSQENFKLTTPIDLENAKLLMNAERVGIGQDSHKFSKEPKLLILGGIEIKECNGLEANSDGDIILHSLFNALSSAVGGKSLGHYADPMCKKGIKDSKEYLKVALSMLKDKNLKINNIGIAIEAKKPRLENYEEKIKQKIAELCGIKKEQVGLTVTSGEGLTPFGKGEAIQVFCIVSLKH